MIGKEDPSWEDYGAEARVSMAAKERSRAKSKADGRNNARGADEAIGMWERNDILG